MGIQKNHKGTKDTKRDYRDVPPEIVGASRYYFDHAGLLPHAVA